MRPCQRSAPSHTSSPSPTSFFLPQGGAGPSGADTSASAAAAGGEPLPDEAQEGRFRATADKAMGDLGTSGDAPFGGEVAVESQVYWWHEKYRPRRPKYFNRCGR